MDTGQRVAHAAALLDAQDIEAALAAIAEAARADPASPHAALGHAQIAFEAWRPASELFARAQALLPGNPDVIRNHALALAAEGGGDTAQALLGAVLEHHPGWLDGHRTLTAMRITAGEADGWDRSYATACQREPANLPLRLAWFQQHATLKRWDAARAVLEAGRAAFAGQRGFDLSDIFLTCESGQAGDMAARFAPFAPLGDPGLDLCRVRHHLRRGEAEEAAAVADAQLNGPAARLFRPYADLCWRLLNDARADEAPLHASIDLDLTAADLSSLAQALHALHRMKAPYPEQSVRGGTQTDRQLFFHPDPAIQAVRAKVTDAIRGYAQALPGRVEGHPLLGHTLTEVRFEGSWSVRLAGAGYHAAHTHPRGWISSALYVALPGADEMGPPPGGWLMLGSPPPELGLPLEPLCQIEPQPGRLVLFPSTTWHATAPFAAGERLSIAFDVRLPRPTT